MYIKIRAQGFRPFRGSKKTSAKDTSIPSSPRLSNIHHTPISGPSAGLPLLLNVSTLPTVTSTCWLKHLTWPTLSTFQRPGAVMTTRLREKSEERNQLYIYISLRVQVFLLIELRWVLDPLFSFIPFWSVQKLQWSRKSFNKQLGQLLGSCHGENSVQDVLHIPVLRKQSAAFYWRHLSTSRTG